MPCEVKWDGRLLRVTLSGRVTEEDLERLLAMVEQAEAEMPVIPNRLIVFCGNTEVAISHQGLQDIAQHRREAKFPNAFKTAIVAGTTLQLGYARMFQILNDNPAITLRIFSDEPTALQWLDAGPVKTATDNR